MVAVLLMMAATAVAAPISPREMELLLRGGVSSAEVERDALNRKLIHPLTEEEAARLKSAGASPELLKVLNSSAAQLDPSEVAALAARQQQQAESRKLSALPRLWVYGFAQPLNDGGVVVSCGLETDKIASKAPRFHDGIYFEKSPPTYEPSGTANRRVVNCEAVIVGKYVLERPGSENVTIPKAAMVNDLGDIKSLPSTAPSEGTGKVGKRSEIAVPLNQWVAVLPVGGASESIYVSEVGKDFIVIAVGRKSRPHRLPVKTGSDNGSDNLTPIAKADDGRELYFVNTPRNRAGVGTFLIIDPEGK